MANESDTRYDDILDNLEAAWGRWIGVCRRIDDTSGSAALAIDLMQETARGDEAAVEVIRDLVEESTYQSLPAPDSVDTASTLDEARRTMEHHHDRLLGALRTVAETREEVVSAVETRIGPLTWEQYPDRAERLTSTGSSAG